MLQFHFINEHLSRNYLVLFNTCTNKSMKLPIINFIILYDIYNCVQFCVLLKSKYQKTQSMNGPSN